MSTAAPKPWIFDERLRAERDYWLERLSGPRELSNLRLDFERPAKFESDRETVEIALPDDVFRSISRLSNNSPFLCYTLLLTGLKVCLQKYTQSRSIVVGSPSRRVEGEEAANVLAIVDTIDDSLPFRALLTQVRETLIEAYARQSYPFDHLVRDVAGDAATNRCPLLDMALLLKNIHHQLPSIKNDLTISFELKEDQLPGVIEFERALFRRESIERFARHYAELLRGALQNVNMPVRALEILSEDERQQLLYEWNETTTPPTSAKYVHELFAEVAARRPDAIAVNDDDRYLTYYELNQRANQLAHFLIKSGVGPETLVGLCMERSLESVLAMLGILKAGGAYLPLDPSYPEARLAYMLEDSQAQFLLASKDKLQTGARVITLDAEEIKQQGTLDPQNRVTADNLAYVIYTSGSTGTPKGVMVSHGGLRNLAAAQIKAFHLAPESRVLQFASLSFDASVSEVFTTLLSGASLLLGKRDDMYTAANVVDILRERSITTVTLPPALLAIMPEDELPALETLVSAGEACSASVVNGWSKGRNFINAYGPTETTVCATLVECDKNYSALPPIGRPIDNTQVYLLDEHKNPVPLGAAGELYIGGAGLARGYWNRPELTAKSFVAHPFSNEPGARLYRSGDLGRYLPDGHIEFLGRADHQIKIRGFRIELGEIENALKLSPALQNAVVIEHEDTPGDRRLVAYVVFKPDQSVTTTELREFLKESLPEYMLPASFVVMAELPLTPNGKIDRDRLPAPQRVRQRNIVPPRTVTEQMLVDIWIEVLKVENVGIEDNFFELGGHSLLAGQVVARVLDVFNVDLPVRVVFESPTIAELNLALLEYQASQFDEDGTMLDEIEELSDSSAEAMITEGFAQKV